MAATTAEREAVRKRAAAAGKTSTTAGINATVAKNRAAVVVPPAAAAVAKVSALGARLATPGDWHEVQVPRPNANAVANANPNARFKRVPKKGDSTPPISTGYQPKGPREQEGLAAQAEAQRLWTEANPGKEYPGPAPLRTAPLRPAVRGARPSRRRRAKK